VPKGDSLYESTTESSDLLSQRFTRLPELLNSSNSTITRENDINAECGASVEPRELGDLSNT